MDILEILPHFNASLNAVSLVLISFAYIAIKSGNKERHKKLMVSALSVSVVFLISYLYYHGKIGHVPFEGVGFVRPVYFTILFTHIGFAAVCLILIIFTVLRAIMGQFERHKKIARITFPIWAFVCVSGIIVYVMAFHLFTGAA